MNNISTCFKYNEKDAKIISQLMTIDPEEKINLLKEIKSQLSDYAYWFLVTTLWVDDSAIASISIWKELFSEKRANQKLSLMKPSEYKALPNKLKVYRAHSENEIDWISYTLDLKTAIEFARRKSIHEITEYKVKKHDCQALFLRREESEIICLDKKMVRMCRIIKLNDEWRGYE